MEYPHTMEDGLHAVEEHAFNHALANGHTSMHDCPVHSVLISMHKHLHAFLRACMHACVRVLISRAIKPAEDLGASRGFGDKGIEAAQNDWC
eukprot:1142656-Pelagomonas_calceolata.AAC.2